MSKCNCRNCNRTKLGTKNNYPIKKPVERKNQYMLVKNWVDCNSPGNQKPMMNTWFVVTGRKKAEGLFNFFLGTTSKLGYCCATSFELLKIPYQEIIRI